MINRQRCSHLARATAVGKRPARKGVRDEAGLLRQPAERPRGAFKAEGAMIAMFRSLTSVLCLARVRAL